MEHIEGSYVRDGEKFGYEVQYTPRQWQAKVRDAHGCLVGSPSVGVHGRINKGEALREDVREWIERCIRERVGVY